MSIKWRIVFTARYQLYLCDYWSEVKGFWRAGISSMYRENDRKVFSEVKWRELKWGEDQLKAVKGRELRQGGMWSVYKGSELEGSSSLSEMFEIEYCAVWLTHCLVYLVVFNADSSTLGSSRFWALIVYEIFFILSIEICLECCTLFCVMLYYVCVLLYCILLYHAATGYTPTCS